jgi:hypothetical protein
MNFAKERLCERTRTGRSWNDAGGSVSVVKMIRVLVLLAALVPISTSGAETKAAEEIEHLIAHLGSSGCQFNRNGSWHTSERAVSHLRRKYEYLIKKNLVPSAEAFIERAAAQSSASGKPYLVKCGKTAAVPSAQWLSRELERYRANDGQQNH